MGLRSLYTGYLVLLGSPLLPLDSCMIPSLGARYSHLNGIKQACLTVGYANGATYGYCISLYNTHQTSAEKGRDTALS